MVRLLLVSAVLLVAGAGCAHAQQSTPPPPQGDDPGMVRVGSGPTRAIGLGYGALPNMSGRSVSGFSEHPVVRMVVDGSGAAQAGIRVGDVLLSVNGKDAREGRLFPDRQPGTRYVVRIRRGTEEREVTLVVAEAQ
jgi:predicted metalloprotease with PDZ domain